MAEALTGSSLEYTTLSDFTPLFLNSVRITLARGHTLVLYMSATSSRAGLSLLPVPILAIMGTPASPAASTISILAATVSIQSTI